jgi:hypothetical protein
MTDTARQYLTDFRTRREYCRALVELVRQQQPLLATENYDGLLELLQQKQQLVEALLAETPTTQRWRQDRSQLAADERQACEAVLSEAAALLQSLMTSEQADVQDLQRRRETTFAQLACFTQTDQLQHVYHCDPVCESSLRLDLDL